MLGVVDLLEHMVAFVAQYVHQRVEIVHAVVDHERGHAGRELLAARRANRPDRRTSDGLAGAVGSGERRTAPCLHIDAEVALVPGLQCRSIIRFEEDAAGAYRLNAASSSTLNSNSNSRNTDETDRRKQHG